MPARRKILKIVLGGDGGVGKTTYMHRYCEGIFIPDTKLTVGVNFFSKSIQRGDDVNVSLSIWDLGGQDQFRMLHDQYIIGSRGGLICFALDRWDSFINIKNWISMLRGKIPDLPLFLVGMRADLEMEAQKIPLEEIKTALKEHDLLGYFRTSSKTGEGVSNAMDALVSYIIENECI